MGKSKRMGKNVESSISAKHARHLDNYSVDHVIQRAKERYDMLFDKSDYDVLTESIKDVIDSGEKRLQRK